MGAKKFRCQIIEKNLWRKIGVKKF